LLHLTFTPSARKNREKRWIKQLLEAWSLDWEGKYREGNGGPTTNTTLSKNFGILFILKFRFLWRLLKGAGHPFVSHCCGTVAIQHRVKSALGACHRRLDISFLCWEGMCSTVVVFTAVEKTEWFEFRKFS